MNNDKALYDVAIIGYGPAGITAGIYCARKKLQTVVFGELSGGEIRNSGVIENWPGAGEVDGNELADKFVEHLRRHADDVDIVETVVKEIKTDKAGNFICQSDKQYKARTVIYAAGRHPRHLEVPGEEEFANKGVTYCATCDAPLFTDKEVAVVGGGNTGAEAVIMLQKIAKKIYWLHIGDKLPADQVLINNLKNDEKVKILLNAKTVKIEGENMVNKLRFENTKTGEEENIDVQGIFVSIGAVPNTKPVKNLAALDKYGAVVADRYGETDVPGFFAAGDVTDIRDAQIVVAAGQGCSAALSAADYLARL